MAVVLGLLVAMTYGAGDFLGGLASKRVPPAVVVVHAQAVAIVPLALVALLLPGSDLVGRDVLAGAVAGVAGFTGLLLLYRGLAAGAMSVVAPLTAVGAAVVPLAWGLVRGERPGVAALLGVVLALAAVALVAAPGQDASGAERAEARATTANRRRDVALALAAGGAFGTFFVLLGSVSGDSGVWPVLGAKVSSACVGAVFLLVTKAAVPPPRAAMPMVAGAGTFDATANVLFTVAAREGLLSLVSVLASLYPASTVVLARVVLHERVSRRQQGGLAMALAGVALIAGG